MVLEIVSSEIKISFFEIRLKIEKAQRIPSFWCCPAATMNSALRPQGTLKNTVLTSSGSISRLALRSPQILKALFDCSEHRRVDIKRMERRKFEIADISCGRWLVEVYP